MSVRETFKNNLRYYRKKNNLTQEELSEKIGLNLNYIADIESRAKFPTAENIDAIADALDIHPAQLFLEQTTPVNSTAFDKTSFADFLVSEISETLKTDIISFLEKNL